MTTQTIYCCGCMNDVEARLTTGAEIYPHRTDLTGLPFWRCDTCKNYVGCHHKTKDRTKPLGNIPTAELRRARGHIHEILDVLWIGDKSKRREIYAKLSAAIGRDYHTAELRTVEEAREIYKLVQKIAAAA